MKRFIVYEHKNIINNKKYIGITCQTNPNRRWENGKGYRNSRVFYNAIQKYGWNNFEHKVLIHDLTFEQACKWEMRLIRFYNTDNDNYGYNMTKGGISVKYSINSKHKKDKSIICLETKIIYSGIRECERETGFAGSGIVNCCKGKYKTCHNFHFMYLEEYNKKTDKQILEHINNNKFQKKVLCIETQEKFESLSSACKKYNIQIGNLWKCLNKITNKTGGYHWEYC